MDKTPTHLDLFSGIGGFALACRWAGFRTVGFSEIDPFCCELLRTRFPRINNFGDVRGIFGGDFGGVRLITGGFPCQPYSVAGNQRGAADDRAIWPEMFRVISEARPTWVLGENVTGIVAMELDQTLSDLEGIGYSTRALVVPACSVNSRQRRYRVWILGHTEHTGRACSQITGSLDEGSSLCKERQDASGQSPGPTWWDTEPELARVVNGLPTKLDKSRIKSLANSIVPQVAYEILREIRRLI